MYMQTYRFIVTNPSNVNMWKKNLSKKKFLSCIFNSQRHRDYLDQRIDKCLKLNQTVSETKPWSKNRLYLIFENIFYQMRKPQNNSDQSAFHLSGTHIDVQLILLMAVLEENKTTAYVTETIRHTHTYCTHSPDIVKNITWGPPNNIKLLNDFHQQVSLQLFWGCFPKPILTCGPSTETSAPRSPFRHLQPENSIQSKSIQKETWREHPLRAWITQLCSIQRESAFQLQGPAGSLNCHSVMKSDTNFSCFHPWSFLWP